MINVLMSPNRGIDLIVAVSDALGAAQAKISGEPGTRYFFPVVEWKIVPQPPSENLLWAFQLPGGAELSFQIDRSAALHMIEALEVACQGAAPLPHPSATKH